MRKSFVSGLGLLGIAGSIHCQPLPQTASIFLENLTPYSVRDLGVSADGKQACVVSSYVNERDESTSQISLTMVDLDAKKASWTKHIEPPDDSANVYPVACRFHGDRLYLLANADTSSSQLNSHGLVFIYQFDQKGKALKHMQVPLETGSAIAIGLLVHQDKLHVVSYGKDSDTKNEYYSSFVSTFDASLAFLTRVSKDGAYGQRSALRAVGKHWYMGGDFFAKAMPNTELLVEYANSKLTPRGAYAWSVRPQHKTGRGQEVVSAIDDQANIYSLSQVDGTSSLIAVDATGKAAPAKTYKSAYCSVNSLSAGGAGLLAIREACGKGPRKSALVWIDPAAGTERTLDLLGSAPKYISADGENWYGVGATGRKLNFVFGKLEKHTAAPAPGPRFAQERAGIRHELRIANLKTDARGVPSFDYTYRQQGPGCTMTLAGKAVASDDSPGSGKAELTIYNPQNADGSEAAPILLLDDGDVHFTVPFKEIKNPRSITFDTVLTDALRAASCNNKARRIELAFSKPVP